jgi:poly(A) polymerase
MPERALRRTTFASCGSGRPDAEGLKACARAKGSLAKLSAERVWSETKKLLAAPDPGRALLWMRQAGVLTEILPETEKWGIDAIPGLIEAEKAFGWSPDALLRLAAIVPPDRARLKTLAERLRLSKAEAAVLDHWAAAPEIAPKLAETAFERLLYRNGPLARAEKWQKPSFPLTGADVLAAGVAAGPKVGAVLGAIEEEWVAGNFQAGRAKLLARLEALAKDG